MSRCTGITLLLIGVALIICGFNAPVPVSADVSRAFAGVLTGKTLGLLVGGSAAVVLGATMAFFPSGKKFE